MGVKTSVKTGDGKTMNQVEVIIVGSGLAALQTAIEVSKSKHVMLITKSKLRHSNSYLAQGGIAVAMAKQDQPVFHREDTLQAGRHYNKVDVVETLVEQAPLIMKELISSGMEFDRNVDGSLVFGMEGAHSERRILHSHGDATGKYVTEHLLRLLADTNVEIVEDTAVVELMIGDDQSCIGVKTIDEQGQMKAVYAEQTVLATGGCGSLFQLTSNASTVAGDGIALALKAGARIRDMEFIQFHPTLLYCNGKTHGLISEAVRGEGAKLVTAMGQEIMEDVHPLKDLAPRHVVAQTIYSYLQRGEVIYLDISMIADFKAHFPTVADICESQGIDLAEGKIPVAPGNHFLMGGIETNQIGQTSVKGLYAVGEVACTGVHGANRLASNSLLEGLVFGQALGEYLRQVPMRKIPRAKKTSASRLSVGRLPDLAEIQERLMNQAGIVRNGADLARLKAWLESFDLVQLLDTSCEQTTLAELTKINSVLVSWLIAESALARTESRGGHFRSDYPVEKDAEWLHTPIVLDRNKISRMLKGTVFYESIKA